PAQCGSACECSAVPGGIAFRRIRGDGGEDPRAQALDAPASHFLAEPHPADAELLEAPSLRDTAESGDEQLRIHHAVSIRHPRAPAPRDPRELWMTREPAAPVEIDETGADTPVVGRNRGKRPSSGVSAPGTYAGTPVSARVGHRQQVELLVELLQRELAALDVAEVDHGVAHGDALGDRVLGDLRGGLVA